MDGSSTPIRLGEGESADISRDGKWALATRFWTQPPEIVLLPTGAGQPRTLPPTGLENVSNTELFPSGDRLLILGNERGRPVRIYVRALDGGPLRPITPEGVLARRGAISPDGRWVAGLVRGGEALLYPVEGGQPRTIPGKLPEEVALGWSADGKSLYVGTPGLRPFQAFRVDLATGKRTLWAEQKGPEDRAGTSGGVMVLGRDDHTYAYVYSRTLSELFVASGLR
jgi:hypothetical protein